jgi:hypothetical protein
VVRERPVAIVAVNPHHRDPDCGRDVGILVATIEAGGIKHAPLRKKPATPYF